ncbi:hypothetical protein [Amycolatopsis samaneae]|uniref:Uncharacterized protein n=1 Tax=Amycolatopsis samaneae TaxID=664691 RepID=A0ABW5GVE8_9PSEU
MSFSVNRVSWREWLGLAAGLLALGATFLPWTTLSTSRPDVKDALNSLPHDDVVRDAWGADFFSWFPPLLLLFAGLAVTLFGQIRKVRISGLPQLWLVADAAVLVLMLIGWVTNDWQFTADQRGLFDAGGIVIGLGAGRYLGLGAALVAFVVAILDIRAARAESRMPRRR